jgi:hypothetical protein
MMTTAHFHPWPADERPCWSCRHFERLLPRAGAALCRLPRAPRVRSRPAHGCASFEREPGSDDEPPRSR